LGVYGQCFGYPEFSVSLKEGKISEVRVLRGAPCGATWSAASRVVGQTPEEAEVNMGLAVQFGCTADPANWEPLGGQSPVHLAAKVHQSAMRKALQQAEQEDSNGK
jgi:hypothetical protein